MDAKLFRLPTNPNYYPAGNPFDISAKGRFTQAPSPNPRFPGYAAQMSDGRLVTDYQPECSKNVPTGRQFATKEWMVKNATEIIRVGRERDTRSRRGPTTSRPRPCRRRRCAWSARPPTAPGEQPGRRGALELSVSGPPRRRSLAHGRRTCRSPPRAQSRDERPSMKAAATLYGAKRMPLEISDARTRYGPSL